MDRLQVVLARAGLTSRRGAEELIRAGRVMVNGQTVRELGLKVDPQLDRLEVDGRRVGAAEEKVYLLLNKPLGYITSLRDPQGRPCVTELLRGVRQRVFPVGRLDYDSEGLLLLTNDGDLAYRLTHPRYGVAKEYRVLVKGRPTAATLARLAGGVLLEDGPTAPAEVRLLAHQGRDSWLALTIKEGRKRQVRRMCQGVGHPVRRLVRVREGSIHLGDLAPGSFRHLYPEEVDRLRAEVRRPVVGPRVMPMRAKKIRPEAGN